MIGINIITCYTLLDITYTGVVRSSSDKNVRKKRNQQRNYETLLQVIGLRTQPMVFEKPYLLRGEDLATYKFGDNYSGKQSVWVFKFSIEYTDVYKRDNNELALLEEDTNQVPVIIGLDETIDLPVPIFSTAYDYKNTYFTTE